MWAKCAALPLFNPTLTYINQHVDRGVSGQQGVRAEQHGAAAAGPAAPGPPHAGYGCRTIGERCRKSIVRLEPVRLPRLTPLLAASLLTRRPA